MISFAVGEPDFNTPEPICEAANRALRDGITKYTPSAGLPSLRAAIAEKLQRENGLRYSPEQVVVSCGAKHAVYNALTVLVEGGDEVILIAPYWMTYAEQIKLAGGKPVVVHTDAASGFRPTREQLRAAVTSRTRAIIINSPSNPSGAVLPRETLKEIAALALRHSLWIVTDEIYERFNYGSRHESIAGLGKEVYDRTVTVNGFSKTFSMTGWRIGYSAAPLHVAEAISTLQDQVTSNPTSFAQMGALAALAMPPEPIEAIRLEFQARRDLMLGRMRSIDGLRACIPEGAFYAMPDVTRFLGVCCKDDAALADYLLDKALVATVPGSVFEGPGYLRFSYAAGRQDIERGMDRLAEALGGLRA